jgi:acyl carrier protein
MTGSDEAESAIADEVMQFVANARGMSLGRIHPDSRLLEDLGLDGDDALELMLDFFERFHVSKDGFVFNQYFGPEAGWSPLPSSGESH